MELDIIGLYPNLNYILFLCKSSKFELYIIIVPYRNFKEEEYTMATLINHIEIKYVLGKGVKVIYVNSKGQKVVTGSFFHLADYVKFLKAMRAKKDETIANIRARLAA